jgi:hypothetical protein
MLFIFLLASIINSKLGMPRNEIIHFCKLGRFSLKRNAYLDRRQTKDPILGEVYKNKNSQLIILSK